MRTQRKLIVALSVALFTMSVHHVALAQTTLPPTPAWRDVTNRAVLRNKTLEASFQSGLLYRLQDLGTGKVLLSVDPAQLPSTRIIFDDKPSDLDACKISQNATPTSVETTFTAPDGTGWQTRWSIEPGSGDLILHSSGKPQQPVEQFRAILPDCDIADHTIVWVDAYGVGRVGHAPWDGVALGDPEREGSPSGHAQPLVALFQGKGSGWLIEGRDPRIGPANVLIKGKGNTATVGMVRRFPIATKTPELYEVRLRTYRERWENAIDPYVAWLEKGAGYVPLEKQSPSWIKDIETQAYVEVGNFDHLEALAKSVDPKKTYLGRQPGFGFYGFDMGYPDYRVRDDAKKWFKRARELGFHVGAHFNSHSLSVMFPELVERFKPGFAVTGTDAQGKPIYQSIYQGPGELIRVAAAYKPWRDYLVGQLRDAVEAGVDVIYLDESMTPAGKYVVDGVDGFQGMFQLMKQVRETYPHVAIETEQFNTLTAKYGAFALSQMPLGHPLSGYIFRRYVKVVPEGIMYSPTDEPIMDAFDSWGYMLPGAAPHFRESNVEITQAFQKYNLKPDSRLPHFTFTEYQSHYSHGLTPVSDRPVPPEGLRLFGYRGSKGVTAYFEKHPGRRGLVVYEPGKQPQWFGTRYSGLTSYTGPGLPVYFYFRHTVRDWLIYDDKGLMGLNPTESYWFDKSLKPSPTRFHVTKIPADFKGVIDTDKRIPPQEIGENDSFFQLVFTGNGTMEAYIPEGYDAYLDGEKVQVDPATHLATMQVNTSSDTATKRKGAGYVIGNTTTEGSPTASHPSTLLAVKRVDTELTGNWRDLPWKTTLDSLTLAEAKDATDFSTAVGGIGRINGKLPAAKSIRLQGTYQMNDDGPGPPGDGIVRLNGKEVVRLAHGIRPYPKQAFDVDISSFAGQYVLLEFISDGWPGRTSSAMWIQPRIVVER